MATTGQLGNYTLTTTTRQFAIYPKVVCKQTGKARTVRVLRQYRTLTLTHNKGGAVVVTRYTHQGVWLYRVLHYQPAVAPVAVPTGYGGTTRTQQPATTTPPASTYGVPATVQTVVATVARLCCNGCFATAATLVQQHLGN